MITLSFNMIMHKIKNNNKSKITQLAYLGLEPKSSHTTKYSQPFKLVLFHITQSTLNALKAHATRIY